MKILIISSVGNAPLARNRANSYMEGFEKMGHKAEILDILKYYSLNPVNRILNWFFRPHRYYNTNGLNGAVLEKVKTGKPNMVLFFKPIYISRETIIAIKKQGALVFSWSGDSVFFPRNISRDFLRAVPYYDCFFTPTPEEIGELMRLGGKKAVFLPPAVDID